MNVLLLNPAYPYGFWRFSLTRVITGTKALSPPLGLITVAAMLPQDWSFRLIDLNCRPVTEADWEWAETVMVSSMVVQYRSATELIMEAKSRGKTVVSGGPLPTAVPDFHVRAGCDYVVQGEGEAVVPELLKAMAEDRPGVIESRERPDLSLSPVPRFDLLHLNDYTTISVQTSRGCPFDCEFCDVVNLNGHRQRHKSTDQVVAELETLYQLGWRRDMLISDDNFIGHRKHAHNMLKAITAWMESRGKPFSTFTSQVSLNLGQDKETIDLMTRPNFTMVFVGVETPDEGALRGFGKTQNLKGSMVESLANLQRNGLSVTASFIIGSDNEGPNQAKQIRDLLEAANIPIAMVNLMNPMPGTRFQKRLEEEGRLIPEWELAKDLSPDVLRYDLDQELGYFLAFKPDRPSREVLEDWREATRSVAEPVGFLMRNYRSILDTRPTRQKLALHEGRTPPPETIPGKRSIRLEIADLIRGMRIIRSWMKILPNPWLIWKLIRAIRRKNPSRSVRFFVNSAYGLEMMEYAKFVNNQVELELKRLDSLGDPDQDTGEAPAGEGSG